MLKRLVTDLSMDQIVLHDIIRQKLRSLLDFGISQQRHFIAFKPMVYGHSPPACVAILFWRPTVSLRIADSRGIPE